MISGFEGRAIRGPCGIACTTGIYGGALSHEAQISLVDPAGFRAVGIDITLCREFRTFFSWQRFGNLGHPGQVGGGGEQDCNAILAILPLPHLLAD